MALKRKGKKMYEDLRSLNLEKLDFDEMVALYSFGRNMMVSYGLFLMETPEWITDKVTALEKEIKARRRDALEKLRKDTERELEGYKSKEEKRLEALKRLERIKEQLA